MSAPAVGLLLDTLRLHGAPSDESLRARWATTNLSGLNRLVRFEGVEVWLARRARAVGAVPPGPQARVMRQLAQHTTAQNMRIDAQTQRVLDVLDAAGMPVALIKGQARRAAAGRYPFADARAISDVDLLVPEATAEASWRALCAQGFRPLYPDGSPWVVTHHLPVLTSDDLVTVELHTTLAPTLSPAEAWARATTDPDTVTWAGRTVRVPNATELLWQALHHAVADGTRGYRLKTFLNVACILAGEGPIAWDVVAARIAAGEIRHDETGPAIAAERIHRDLAVAAELAGVPIPVALHPHRAVRIDALLAWRLAVLKAPVGESMRDRLLEEGLRVEAQLPVTPVSPERGALRALRRRTASRVARLLYRSWAARR